ncbi:MAG: glycoside hydrolase family 65 protein, partial [Gammaproteobacteria bacterium]|nr:glycoside hydrolase family 65 protein [Gammaproteobacteria bacterium]
MNNLKDLLSSKEWLVEEKEFDINRINHFETIFTLGNGYLGTRGSLESSHTAAFPQTFINGLFDHHDSSVVHMVNAPDWVPLTIIANNERLSLQNSEIIEFHRILDLKQGLLYRLTRFKDPKGHITRYESIRYTSFAEQHLCEIKATVTPENYSGEITIRSVIDGHTFNIDRIPAYNSMNFDPEVKWEKWAKSKHLSHVVTKPLSNNNLYLEMQTLDRPHSLGYASALNVTSKNKADMYCMCDYERTYHVANVKAKKGELIQIEKIVTIHTSRDTDKTALAATCEKTLTQNIALSFDKRFAAHKKVWEQKWHDSDVIIVGDKKAQHALRFNIYHLLISANEFDPKTNIGAKTLSGEGYKGHIFWDTEIFALPFFIYTQPATAKSLLMYRYNTLEGAKENAELTGYKGARYPWESADYGHEETPRWSPDGKHRIWPGEEEIHITADVVRGLGSYFAATLDVDFLINNAAPIIFETARFWASRLEYNKDKDRYELSSVIGPDEYHEHVNNNVFTNSMARWNLQKAVELYHWLHTQQPDAFNAISQTLNIADEEIDSWENIAKKIYILYDPSTKLFEEFEDYFKLRDVSVTELDDEGMPIYPKGLGDFNSGTTMLVKQADVVALLYILADEFNDEIKKVNYAFYEPRTMHASSLSASIHAIMAIETRNIEKAVKYFTYTSEIDLYDHKGSTQDGIHMASTGGTWQAVVCGFGGMRVKNRQLTFKPWLPTNWEEIRFKIKWHGENLNVAIRKQEAEFFWDSKQAESLNIEVMDKSLVILPK